MGVVCFTVLSRPQCANPFRHYFVGRLKFRNRANTNRTGSTHAQSSGTLFIYFLRIFRVQLRRRMAFRKDLAMNVSNNKESIPLPHPCWWLKVTYEAREISHSRILDSCSALTVNGSRGEGVRWYATPMTLMVTYDLGHTIYPRYSRPLHHAYTYCHNSQHDNRLDF